MSYCANSFSVAASTPIRDYYIVICLTKTDMVDIREIPCF